MDLKHIVEMLMMDITAEGGIGTVFAILLLLGMFLGGGIEPLIDALASLI